MKFGPFVRGPTTKRILKWDDPPSRLQNFNLDSFLWNFLSSLPQASVTSTCTSGTCDFHRECRESASVVSMGKWETCMGKMYVPLKLLKTDMNVGKETNVVFSFTYGGIYIYSAPYFEKFTYYKACVWKARWIWSHVVFRKDLTS